MNEAIKEKTEIFKVLFFELREENEKNAMY